MKQVFKPGAKKQHRKIIGEQDIALFQGQEVHPVCSTFALAREIEWSTRLFVLDMLEPDEEGIGTMLLIHHKSPAYLGEELEIEAEFKSLKKNELICNYTVLVESRIIAVGETGQKILKKEKLKELFNR